MTITVLRHALAGRASVPPSRLYPDGSEARLNLQDGWWLLYRRDAFAGQSFANAEEIEQAMHVATAAQPAGYTLDLWTLSQGSSSVSVCLSLPDLTYGALLPRSPFAALQPFPQKEI